MDFCGPFPTGESIFVIIDSYSKFPEVEIMKKTTAPTVITKLERIFATHGLPTKVTSDNGPPFNSHVLSNYFKENGIIHHRVTPIRPQVNGEVESFMRPLNKAIRSAKIQGQDWRHVLYRFLLANRTTPHTTTGEAPAELLYNRVIRSGIPSVNKKSTSVQIEERNKKIQERMRQQKEKVKKYVDRTRKAKDTDLKVGDTVLQDKKNKFSTSYDPQAYKVVSIKGSSVTARRRDKDITRHAFVYEEIFGICERKWGGRGHIR